MIRFFAVSFRVFGWVLVIFSIIWISQVISLIREQEQTANVIAILYKSFLGIGIDRFVLAGMDMVFAGLGSLGISDVLCRILKPGEKSGVAYFIFRGVVLLYMFALIVKYAIWWANYLGVFLSKERDYSQWWQALNFFAPSLSLLVLKILALYAVLRIYGVIRASLEAYQEQNLENQAG